MRHSRIRRRRAKQGESKFESLMRRLSANPVATGESAAVSLAAISGDRFDQFGCLRCYRAGGLYVFERRYIILCAHCTQERITRLSEMGEELPPSVEWLLEEVTRSICTQLRQEKEALSIELDVFCRCNPCGKLIKRKDARYPEGPSPIYPHCLPCYTIVKAGGDPGTGWQKQCDFGQH